MRLIELAEIANMEEGEPVPSVAGTLKYVNEYKTGNKNGNDWSLQPIVLEDNGVEVRAVLWNRPQLPKSAKGDSVIISCVNSAKHGLRGVTVKRNDYKGKITNELNVSEGASFKSADGRSTNGAEDRPNDDPRPSQVEQPTLKLDGITAARHHLMKAANLYLKCLDAADYIRAHTKVELTDAHFQALTSTLFIAADRQGLVAGMPDKPIQPPAKPEPPDEVPGGEPPDADPEW